MAQRTLEQQRTRLAEPALQHAHHDFARVHVNQTVDRAISEVRDSQVTSRIVYFYVVDEQERLVGVIPTRRLLLSPPQLSVADVMISRVIQLPHYATLLDACEMFVFHRLMALPIVNDAGQILGIIDVDQYTDEIRELDAHEESEEIFQLIGVRLAQVQHAPLGLRFRSRFPWLLCNIAGGIACAFVAGAFETVLQQWVLLALFIPVVLALAESVSIQSLTLALQIQHRRGMPWRAILQALQGETPLGLMLGTACGLAVGAIAWMWQGHGSVAACIFTGIAASVMLAATYGLLIPSLLHKFQRDPKLASGPLTLAMTDITTTVVYLGISTWWLL